MRLLAVYAVLSLLMAFSQNAATRPAVFWQSQLDTRIALGFYDLETTEFPADQGEVDGGESEFNAQWAPENKAWSLGLGHEYSALEMELPGAEPATNGDLHTVWVSANWRHVGEQGQLDITLAPAITASSNALREPSEITSEAYQLWGSLLYQRPRGTVDWVVGVAHDYRFGESRVYPVAGLVKSWQRASLRLTYPDLSFNWHFADHWQFRATTAPDGNKWQAYERDFVSKDRFSREGWLSEIGLSYRFGSGIELGFSAGLRWRQSWRFRLDNGAVFDADSDDNVRFGLHVGWQPDR